MTDGYKVPGGKAMKYEASIVIRIRRKKSRARWYAATAVALALLALAYLRWRGAI
jgi:hypothetical protein